jgi:hypothetical protein
MKSIHWILTISLYIVSHVSFAQESTFPDTTFLKQEYARQQAIKVELEKLKAMQLKYQEDKKNTSSEKITLTSLPVHWEERGPTGMPNGITQVLIDANDPTGKKAWAATLGGLWYNNDITADSSWHLTSIETQVFSIAQNPTNSLEIVISNTDGVFNISNNGGITWNQGTGTFGANLVYNNNGDLYSSCLNGCSGNAYIHKLNRTTLQFEFYLDIQTTLWQETNPEISDIAFDHENLIYISLENGKIYRSSTPSGGTWTNIMTAALSATSSQTNIGIGKDVNNNKVIYAINLKQNGGFTNNINWIRKSVNGGTSWTNLSIPTLNTVQMRAIYFALIYVNPSNINHVAILGDDFVSSSNGGSTWKFANEGFGNNRSIAKNPNSNYILAAAENKIVQLSNAFSSGNISSEPRIKGLNTSFIWELGFRNVYNDSVYYNYDNILKGRSILKKSANNALYSTKFFDNNEPDVSFSFTPTLNYFDQYGNTISRGNVSVENRGYQGDYDEIGNTLIAYKFSSQINNQTVFSRVRNIGSKEEVLDNLLLNKYLSNIYEVKILNDSIFYVFNNNTTSQQNETFKLTINPDNTISYTLQTEYGPSSPYRLKTISANPNALYSLFQGEISLSTDEGITWIEKTNSIPENMNDYTLNPSNPNQVFTNSSNKIYVSNNFLSTNVIWEDITGDLSHIPYHLYKMWYRETDGQLVISNLYRGLFSTNYFQSSVPDSVIIANYTKEACVNKKVKVSFYKNGAFSETNTYELWISDAAGNFTNATKIGTSSNSPIYGIIPDHLVAGTNYKLRVISTNPAVAIKQADTGLFEVKKGNGSFLSGYPKAINATQNGFVINAPVNQNAEVWYVVTQTGKPRPSIDQIISGIDSEGIAYLVSDSVIALTNTSNPIIIKGLLSGTSYDAYVTTKLPTEVCFSAISKVTFSTKGTPATYCIPQSINGCSGDNYISEIGVFNFDNSQYSTLSNLNSACGPNSYSFNSQNMEVLIAGISNKVILPRIHDFQGTFPPRGVAIWIDFNENGDFEDPGELMNSNPVDMNNYSFSFYANPTVSPGIKRLRIRLNSGTEYTFPMSPCATYQYGETEDYLVKVETNEPYIFANLDKDSVGQCEVIKVVMDVTGSYNFDNVFKVELSNATGNFADSTVILSGLSVDLPVNIQIPQNLPSGNGYKLRVVSTDPVAVSYESATFTITPQTQEIITDFSSASHTINQIGTISAKNKNTNTAKVNFKGWNSVLLLPNFEAKPSTTGSFKAEIVGCNN